jgi:putative ABC transport system permease protein
MFRNYLKIAWRNLIKYKGFSVINILGLTIGIACCIAISLFITDELSYDKQNVDSDRIYRIVTTVINDDGTKVPEATTPPALAEAMQKDIPEVAHVVRLFPPTSGIGNRFYVRYGDKQFMEESIYRVDAGVFDVFTFPFVVGDPKTALSNPDAIVLTESMAKKYFANENPIGKTLYVDDWAPQLVTAVIKDVPANMHFKFDFLISLASLNTENRFTNIWNWNSFYTYAKLKPGSDIEKVDQKIRAIFAKNVPGSKNYLYSQPLTTIHLSSNLKGELGNNGDKTYTFIFSAIALFVLLIACINYVNLTTARSAIRTKEIGIRKISGALRPALVKQFLTEAVFFATISGIVAIILVQLCLPGINNITGKQLTLITYEHSSIIFAIIGFALVAGLVAGLYPALVMSSFNPVRAFTFGKLYNAGNLSIRKILVVAQFSIAIALIIGMIVVTQQVSFMQHVKLGLDKDHVIVINDIGYLDSSACKVLKTELLKINGVEKVAASDGIPGGFNWSRTMRYSRATQRQLINFLSVDEDYIPALSIPIVQGRNFSGSNVSDARDAIMLNETALKELGIPEPVIGQKIVWNENRKTGDISYATLIGVVKDFHFASMKDEIKPFAFIVRSNRQWQFNIKIQGLHMAETLEKIKNVWKENTKSRPFQYSFLDETYARLYAGELHFKQIFTWITFIAILIACMGLLGLAILTAERRTKEIGIRKVLGASVAGITAMLSKDFIILIAVAILIASPVSWYFMHQWLLNFAYKISISGWVFVWAGLSAVILAFIAVAFQSMKAAMANPVKLLRTE